MDLDDLLEDLLEGAGRAARRGYQRVATSTRPARRRARRLILTVASVLAVGLLGLGGAMTFLGDPSALEVLLGAMLLISGTVSAGAAVAAGMLDRRDPDVRRARAAARGTLTPEMLDDDMGELPRDVRAEFRRMLQARRLVQDLAADGWVDARAMLEVDGEIARLHRLLVADRRTTALGGRPSAPLRAQTAELADLLVALADEAVAQQVTELSDRSRASVTLGDAREHLIALREARQEVQAVEEGRAPEVRRRAEG